MRGWVAAVVLAAGLGFAGSASADARENVMIKLADVFAIQRMCPNLKVNTSTFMMLAMGYKIDISEGTPDYTKLMAMSLDRFKSLQDMSDGACAAGVFLYGPNGQNMKDLIKME